MPCRFLMLGIIILAGAMPVALAQQQPDRNLLMPEISKDWKTLETPHFRIHHEAANKEYAQNLAAIAERVHDKLSGWLAWQPQDKTEVLILDTVDLSNGSAFPLPYNRISIYMPPPVDGELMDQSPWLEMVFTHEYVHILHLDMAYGAPQKVRNVFGRSMDLFSLLDFPQIFAPTWVTEGIAVYGESEHAGQYGNAANYGRLNSAFYEGMMRMEVQRGLRSLTEVSFNSGFRWPYGQVYLYGAYFFKFVETHYGRDAVTNYIRVYGTNLIPFRMDSRSEEIFGKSAQTVWAEFQDYLTQRFAPQLAAIKQQDRFVTHTVYDALYSNSALAPAANGDLYFLHDDASSRPEIRRLRADGTSEAVLDGRGVQEIAWHDEAGLLLSKFAVCDNTNIYADLYQWKPGMSSARRLTHCGRYTFAAWRPDGQAIAAIQSERGMSRLLLLDATGKMVGVLADMPQGDTLGHISWSPDGNSLVASIQRKETGWNLELLDIKTHLWRVLTANSELVQRPQFSKDGREIYFLSDHGKVWNLRRLKLGSEQIDTISNTASAITEAVVMPDKSYRMVEYTPNGKAIIALEAVTEPAGTGYAAKTSALPPVAAISNAPDYQPYPYTDVKDYSPWSTLKPHYWFPLIDSSADQTSYVGVLLSGSDALDFHQWSAIPLYYYDQKAFGGLASYSFYNNVTLSAQRQFVMQGSIDSTVRYRDEEVRYQALLHHSFNTLDSGLYLAAGVASEEINSQLLKGSGADQTYHNKITGAIAQFDNSRFYKRSIAPVDGRRVQLLGESYDLLGGSDYSGTTSRLDWNEYIALADNHALHVRMLYAQGDPGIRAYRLGGVSETLSDIGGDTGLGRRDFPLRGYPSGLAALSGSNMGLATAEWKIPLGYHYDGWFVPPLGIGRESLSLFVDSGDAWNQGEAIEFKTGAGVEWNIEALVGYDLLKLATTLGYAHGLDNGGENRVYLRVVIPLF
jgi:Tol biopolymer transport system component